MDVYGHEAIDAFVESEVTEASIERAWDAADWDRAHRELYEVIRATLLSQAVRAKLPASVPDGLLYDGSAGELAARCTEAYIRWKSRHPSVNQGS